MMTDRDGWPERESKESVLLTCLDDHGDYDNDDDESWFKFSFHSPRMIA